MSGKKKCALWAWTLIVLFCAFACFYSSIEVHEYSGDKVTFSASSGVYLDIKTTSPVNISAADSKYFRLFQGQAQLYGVPETPPLGYGSSTYFRLEGVLQNGRWILAEGSSVSFELTGESFTATLSPSSVTFWSNLLVIIIFACLVWMAGIAVAALVTL